MKTMIKSLLRSLALLLGLQQASVLVAVPAKPAAKSAAPASAVRPAAAKPAAPASATAKPAAAPIDPAAVQLMKDVEGFFSGYKQQSNAGKLLTEMTRLQTELEKKGN